MKKGILFITIIGIILDRISKLLVVGKIALGSRIVLIKNFFYLTYVKNDGAAWSILRGNKIFLIAVSVFAIMFLLVSIYKQEKINKLDMIAYSLVLGGIIGNFIDRVVFGYVIDFLDFYIFKYNFPVFNVADSLIVLGALLMAVCVIRGEKNENKS